MWLHVMSPLFILPGIFIENVDVDREPMSAKQRVPSSFGLLSSRLGGNCGPYYQGATGHICLSGTARSLWSFSNIASVNSFNRWCWAHSSGSSLCECPPSTWDSDDMTPSDPPSANPAPTSSVVLAMGSAMARSVSELVG